MSRKMSSSLGKPTAATCTQIVDSEVAINNDNLNDAVNETAEYTDTEDQSSVTANQIIPTVSKTINNYTKRKRNMTDGELLNIERKKIQLIESHLSNVQNSKPQDDLYHFLMSLHKPLSDLPTDRQMFIRIKMQELIYTEITSSNQYKQNIQNSQLRYNSTIPNDSY